MDIKISVKYLILSQNEGIQLTHKELAIIQCLKAGYTAEMTGKKIFISKRTVESSIAKIKKKFNSLSLIHLGFIIGKNNSDGVKS